MASATPNGSADAGTDISAIPPVVGINFGNSYASIAVFTKEGLAESIANEDGERQIACAIAFQGEEMYIGNQAKTQLVKNSKNTITGFRNLIGKKFSEITNTPTSAPVIEHPDKSDVPAYKVEVLTSPKPLSTNNTPAATPRSEPILTERILSVSEVTTLFLKSLLQSAQDFLGKKIQGAVITVPPSFTDAQIAALDKAATDAGVKVLQFLEEAGAVVVATASDQWNPSLEPDRTQLIVDLGSSSLSLSLVSLRQGMGHILGASSTTDVGADQIDDKLITFFAGDFTKKNKIALQVCPSTETSDKRAEAKLRLAIEHTKRTLSASPGAATCSVESLKDGFDYTGSINRMRFDMIAKPVYTAVSSAVSALLSSLNMDAVQVDEIVYVGGTTSLPGLDDSLLASNFSETVSTPFAAGTVVGGGIGDPTTLLARGCAIQAAMLFSPEFSDLFEQQVEAPVLSRTLGVYFPSENTTFVPLMLKETVLPARRIVSVDITLSDTSKAFGFELWEVEESVRVEKVVEPPEYSDEEEEETEVKHKEINKVKLVGAAMGEAKLGIKIKGTGPDKDKWFTTVQLIIQVTEQGTVDTAFAKEIGEGGAFVVLDI